jgi:hypothetical protein
MSSAESLLPADGPPEPAGPAEDEPPVVLHDHLPGQIPPGIEDGLSDSPNSPNHSRDDIESPPAYDAGGRLIRTIPTKGNRYTTRRRCDITQAAEPQARLIIYATSRAQVAHRPIPPGPIQDNSTK